MSNGKDKEREGERVSVGGEYICVLVTEINHTWGGVEIEDGRMLLQNF